MNGLQKVAGDTYRQGGTLGAVNQGGTFGAVKVTDGEGRVKSPVVIDRLESGYVVSVGGMRVALTDKLALLTHLVRHYYPEHMVELVEIERLVTPRVADGRAVFKDWRG